MGYSCKKTVNCKKETVSRETNLSLMTNLKILQKLREKIPEMSFLIVSAISQNNKTSRVLKNTKGYLSQIFCLKTDESYPFIIP